MAWTAGITTGATMAAEFNVTQAEASGAKSRGNHIGTQLAASISDFNAAVDASGAKDRANHTGTQLAATVSDFIAAADARIAAAVINALADVIITAPTDRQVLRHNGTNFVNADNEYVYYVFSLSDLVTPLTVGVNKDSFRLPFAGTLIDVQAEVSTAPTGTGNLTVDMNKNGTTVLSTKLTFDAAEDHTTTAAIPRVISGASFAKWDKVSFDIDAVSGTVTGLGLKVAMTWKVTG